jgi:rhomboid protease GluP
LNTTDESTIDNSRPQTRLGLSYFLGSWTGRLILINTIVFVAICIKSGSVFLPPDTASLLLFGAKDPVLIAKGEFWRFITPIFLHIGLLHFVFNNFMLHVIGQQLERVVGRSWFLTIYLCAGIAGNITSTLFSVHLSAGASGAIFGLLGLGFFLETSIGKKIKDVTGKKPQNRVYGMTVGMNLLFGFMVPFVDNAAHIGGLIAGAVMAVAMVNLRPNKIVVPKKTLGVVAILSVITFSGVGAYFAGSMAYAENRLMDAVGDSEDVSLKYQLLSQAIELNPEFKEARFQRASLLLFNREEGRAIADLREIVEMPEYFDRLNGLAEILKDSGLVKQAWELRRLLDHAGK